MEPKEREEQPFEKLQQALHRNLNFNLLPVFALLLRLRDTNHSIIYTMPSSTTSTEHVSKASSDTMADKKAPKPLPHRKQSLFRRTISKLRSTFCVSDNGATSPTPSTPSTTSIVEAPKNENGKESNTPAAESKDEKPEDQTMKTEFKHLDRKYNSEDQPYFIERKKDDIDVVDKKDWWQLFAFCVVRRYDSDEYLDETCLYVNPQPLRQLLKDVIGNYPSDPIDVDDVQIEAPYHALFHYRKQLAEVGLARFKENEDAHSTEQLQLLLEVSDNLSTPE